MITGQVIIDLCSKIKALFSSVGSVATFKNQCIPVVPYADLARKMI
jgi:hypothetical protein